ncbi:MAG: 1,4-alpha-glucan branching enzyme [Flavobacteriales bacterium]|jgi:1,4-alpha-glucan branching enzyme
MKTTLSENIINQIINSDCDDIFKYLGRHKDGESIVVRSFMPEASAVSIVSYDGLDVLGEGVRLNNAGLFEARLDKTSPDKYLLKVSYSDSTVLVEDVYRFPTLLNADDIYLFNEGTNERAYEFLGAHLRTVDGVDGCCFAVWAPNAKRVSVVGNFNFWDGRRHVMRKHIPGGVWEIFIPGITTGDLYKFELKDSAGNLLPHKADPFGFYAQLPPEQASVVEDHSNYEWKDDVWQQKKHRWTKTDSATTIYEVHLGSWKRVPDQGNRFLSYRELADDLIPYVKEMGFTHLQLMPISEFPFDGSWGYQPVGLFASTSRFGSINDLKFFVDKCHEAEIAVLVDWVPGHFPTDAHGLGRFDGTPLYEHADSRQGFHPDWKTYIYNYGRKEVSNFLMANAHFWLDKFHIDGLRVDAVASMLYLDYSREDGDWIANAHGGRENLDAIDFLKLTNERVYKNYPDSMMVAEESTAWPGVSKPIFSGGLGFGFKWNMGWMNDSLAYMTKDSIHRKYHHNNMTFSLLYAFSENFILPLSHDEVVHGKGSILAKMPGDSWQQFANLRAYYAYMWMHPGKKLLFMGCEFGQGPEWDHENSLCWHQLEAPEHAGVQSLIKDLNKLYTSKPALYNADCDAGGFEWVDADDRHNSIFAFYRYDKTREQSVLIVCNMTPILRHHYRIGVNSPGIYRELLNSDAEIYAGSNQGNAGILHAEDVASHGKHYSLSLTIPPLATVVFELEA